jgi:hypothetical protein
MLLSPDNKVDEFGMLNFFFSSCLRKRDKNKNRNKKATSSGILSFINQNQFPSARAQERRHQHLDFAGKTKETHQHQQPWKNKESANESFFLFVTPLISELTTALAATTTRRDELPPIL